MLEELLAWYRLHSVGPGGASAYHLDPYHITTTFFDHEALASTYM